MSNSKNQFRWKDIFRNSKRKIEITIETKQTLRMQRTTRHYANDCTKCRNETVFLPITEMANAFDMEIEFLELFIRERNVHFIEFDESETVICLKSLISEMDNKITDL